MIIPDSSAPSATSSLARRIVVGLNKLGLALRSHAWRGAAAERLTPTQGQILAMLQSMPASDVRGATLSGIAEQLAVTPATASDAVAALETKGLIRKIRDESDTRRIRLELTWEGWRMAERAALWPDFLLRAVGALEPGEQAVLLRAIIKMIRVLQERGEISVSRMCVTCRFFKPYAHADPQRPHHCAFVDAPFGDAELRLDCQDQEPAPATEAALAWERFARGCSQTGTLPEAEESRPFGPAISKEGEETI
jgi:DNA-binding MarR family transcriptional regulator